ncbi:MAG: diaminopimelate epimerase [Oscillospiraceae bacterium]|nr:diaminopimelate epimerase [Oscillospiraceae bacterium]
MRFTKMHGAGNDYIYFNCFEEKIDDPAALSIKLSDRHFSVGGDGIVLIMPSSVADFRMRIFNADGSEAQMCGNASRCIGKYVYEKGLTDKTTVTLETLAGIKTLNLDVKGGKVESVCVDMGKAEFRASLIPVISDKEEVINEPLEIGGKDYRVTCVSMGNPHCVTFVDEVRSLPLDKIGVLFENNGIFPERVNTEFIRVIDPTTLEMRVWERGSGETLACGTGACASVAAAVRNGICKAGEEVTVRLLGGDLHITCSEEYDIQMRGGAEFAFEGYIE